MSTQPETPEPFDPFAPWRVTRDTTMEAWSRLMIDFVNSEAYSQATSQLLDTYLTLSQPFQHVIETTMTQVLSRLNMPTRTDVTSLAARMTNVETRLDDLDIKLEEIQRAIKTLSVSNHAANTTSLAKTKEVH
jgi:polyhydroxyalkanoic acid synthase PhaR subunit